MGDRIFLALLPTPCEPACTHLAIPGVLDQPVIVFGLFIG